MINKIDFQYQSVCEEMNVGPQENITQDMTLAQSSGKLCLSSGKVNICICSTNLNKSPGMPLVNRVSVSTVNYLGPLY